MAAGRNSKSNEIKKLQGTLRKDRVKGDAILFDPITQLPEAPAYLNALGKKHFAALVQMLISKSMLDNGNVHIVAMLADEMANYEQACKNTKTAASKVMTSPKGYQQQSPWVSIKNVSLKNIIDLGALFGLDPLSRSKIGGGGPKEDANPFTSLMQE